MKKNSLNRGGRLFFPTLYYIFYRKNVPDSPKFSYNKPIQKDLQLPQQTESYRMIGKAPTAKPRVDFKEGSSIQSSIETRKGKMSNQKRIETLKNEPEIKNESINNLKLKSGID